MVAHCKTDEAVRFCPENREINSETEPPAQNPQGIKFGSKPQKTQCPRIICADCPIRFCQAVHLVAKAGIEPATRGFSVRCSTN